jgi:hypothetical protein
MEKLTLNITEEHIKTAYEAVTTAMGVDVCRTCVVALAAGEALGKDIWVNCDGDLSDFGNNMKLLYKGNEEAEKYIESFDYYAGGKRPKPEPTVLEFEAV